MNETVILKLEMSEPRALSPEAAARWDAVVQQASKSDVAGIVFLGELLGMLDRDPAPAFTAKVYSDADMFGGCDQRWSITTRNITLRREQSQEISESWSHVNVDDDWVSIRGLPGSMFVDWNGGVGSYMGLWIGNIPKVLEKPVLNLARTLFKKVEVSRAPGDPHEKVRADLRRRQRNVGNSPDEDSPAQVDRRDIAPIVDALMDEDDDTSLGALDRLERGSLLDDPAVRPGLLKALARGNSVTRMTIAETLGVSGQTQNVAPLIKALDDESDSVRENALLSLGDIGDRSAIPAAVGCLKDGGEQVRWYALAALGDLVTDADWPAVKGPVLARLKDESHYVRGVAVTMVADRAEAAVRKPLLNATRDHSDWVRQEALRGLRKLKDRRCVPAFIRLLDDPEMYVRGQAAAAVAELQDKRAVEPLREALKWSGHDAKLTTQLRDALKALGEKP